MILRGVCIYPFDPGFVLFLFSCICPSFPCCSLGIRGGVWPNHLYMGAQDRTVYMVVEKDGGGVLFFREELSAF